MSAILNANHMLLARAIASGKLPLSSVYPSAGSSPIRTSTSFFPLGNRAENKPADRKELVKKSRYLRNACGLYRGLCEKPVSYAIDGGLIPSSATGDPDFDADSDRYFEDWAASPVDVTGQWDFYGSQSMIVPEVMTDGGLYALKVRAQTTDRCQLQFLRSHQVGDSLSARDTAVAMFRDGHLTNAVGRTIRYRVLQEGQTGNVESRDYDASSVLHIFEPRPGLLRGLPWAYHGENSAIDILDMASLAKVSEKLNVALAGVLTKTGAKPGQLGPPMDVSALFGDSPTNTSNGSGGSPGTPGQATGQVSWETIMGGGAIPVLEDGQTLSAIDLSRKGQQTWIPSVEYFIRDIAVGLGSSFEFIWNPEKLGGPSARFMLEDLVRFCRRVRRMLIARYCQPVREWVIATGMMRGELRECRTPNWRACDWFSPEDATLDKGRMGAMFRNLVDSGMMTRDEWWSMLNKDGRKMRRKAIEEIADDMRICRELQVPYEYYTGKGAAAAQAPLPPVAVDPALVEAIRAALSL